MGKTKLAKKQNAITHDMKLLYRVKKNQVSMMEYRGYDISSEFILESGKIIGNEDFIEQYKMIAQAYIDDNAIIPAMSFVYRKKNGTTAYVRYIDDNDDIVDIKNKEIGNGDIPLIDLYLSREINPEDVTPDMMLKYPFGTYISHFDNVILICETPLNISYSLGKNVEIFAFSELLINPLIHYSTPSFTIFKGAAVDEKLSEINCRRSELPKMLSTDPIAKFGGMRRGDIIEIIQYNFVNSLTPFTYMWRIICDPSPIVKPTPAPPRRKIFHPW